MALDPTDPVAEPKIFLLAPSPALAPAPDSFIRYLKYRNKIKIVTIYNEFFSNHDFFSIKFLQVCGK